MRIGIVGLSIEILLRSPVATDSAAIETYAPQAMLDGDLWLVRGVLDRLAQDADAKAVPLLWATALPGGPVAKEAYEKIKQASLRRLAESMPLDGLVVANHGALEVQDLDGPGDADYVAALRRQIGPDIPIALALDLHGNMTAELLQAASVISVLRTAPHRDDRETGYRAADQLLRVIRRRLAPRTAAVRVPIRVPGEAAMTMFPPADELYGGLAEIDARPGMMEANILVGFSWNDRPWTGMTAIATHESDVEAARRAAQELALKIWRRRYDFRLRMETAEVRTGLLAANRSAQRPVYVSDAGDNTTAGAAGDLTWVLQEILALDEIEDAVVPGIFAPETVRQCLAAGVGATVALDLGREHVSGLQRVRTVSATVEAAAPELRLGGFQPYRSTEDAWARVRIGTHIVTFHAAPIGITTPAHLEAMGIHPTTHQIYVVKVGYLHPQLEDIAGRHIVLMSDGSSQLDLRKLDWRHIDRPAHPLDSDIDWAPEASTYDNDSAAKRRGGLR